MDSQAYQLQDHAKACWAPTKPGVEVPAQMDTRRKHMSASKLSFCCAATPTAREGQGTMSICISQVYRVMGDISKFLYKPCQPVGSGRGRATSAVTGSNIQLT